MEGKQTPPDIRKRSFHYALRAIKPYKALQENRDGACWILGKQYLRSATSVGANVEEAQSGESRADFIHKYAVAQKEAKESLYWLRLLAESGIVSPKRLAPLHARDRRVVRCDFSDHCEGETKGRPAALAASV